MNNISLTLLTVPDLLNPPLLASVRLCGCGFRGASAVAVEGEGLGETVPLAVCSFCGTLAQVFCNAVPLDDGGVSYFLFKMVSGVEEACISSSWNL